MRSVFLAMSQSLWLREQAPKFKFVRRTVARFMPGETLDDALRAACELNQRSVGVVLTHLGENVTDREEAANVATHYLDALDQIRARGLTAEVSVKLTQLGLDLDRGLAYSNLEKIVAHAGTQSIVWIDMESSQYTDVTLDHARQARKAHPNVGVCVQAYLRRTKEDLASLIPLGMAVRLVKGAYQEPARIAFSRKTEVDANYFALAEMLLSDQARELRVRAALATHDGELIRKITEQIRSKGFGKDAAEFQMLYGIRMGEQLRLAGEGWRVRSLISYGRYWYPWFMRRIAERPANAWFALRNLVTS